MHANGDIERGYPPVLPLASRGALVGVKGLSKSAHCQRGFFARTHISNSLTDGMAGKEHGHSLGRLVATCWASLSFEIVVSASLSFETAASPSVSLSSCCSAHEPAQAASQAKVPSVVMDAAVGDGIQAGHWSANCWPALGHV